MEHANYPAFLAGAMELLDKRVAGEGGCTQPTYIDFNYLYGYRANYVCSEAEAVKVYNKVAPANRAAQKAGTELAGSKWDVPDGWWRVDARLCPTAITSLNDAEAPPGEYEYYGAAFCLVLLPSSPLTTEPAPGQEKAYLAEKYRKMLRDLIHVVVVEPSDWDAVRDLLT